MGIKVTDAEVKKSFDEQKKQAFPKDADYQKYLKDSGQTQEDILSRVKLDLLSNKIRDKVVKGKDQVSDKAIADFYDEEQGAFRAAGEARPAGRADQDQGRRRQGARRARGRRLVEDRREAVLDRRHVQGGRRQAAGAGQGHARQGARRGGLLRQEGRAGRPDQDPVRLLRLHASSDVTEAEPADARRGEGDDQADAAGSRASRRRWTRS